MIVEVHHLFVDSCFPLVSYTFLNFYTLIFLPLAYSVHIPSKASMTTVERTMKIMMLMTMKTVVKLVIIRSLSSCWKKRFAIYEIQSSTSTDYECIPWGLNQTAGP